jgi:hypothetical protein
MAGFWSWLSNGVDAAKDANNIDKAAAEIERACRELAGTQNPTTAQIDAVNAAFAKWTDALADVGGNVGYGIPIPFADMAISSLIKDLQQSPAVQLPHLERAQKILEDAKVREVGARERNICERSAGIFKNAQAAPPPKVDPLVIDLDDDGIETVSTSASILFDHDGDGLKTASGWVKGDDGFLVLDRNGNGRVCQSNCVTSVFHHNAATGTRSSPN